MTAEHLVSYVLEEDGLDFLRESLSWVVQQLMEAEVSELVGAARGERAPAERLTHRNGYRARTWATRAGEIEPAIPKLRRGSYFPSFLEPRKRSEQALVSVVGEAYVAGVSTRKVDHVRNYLAPRFDSMTLGEIRRPDVKALVGELEDAGKARNTIRNIISPLRSMLRETVRDDLIAANPAADVEISGPERDAQVPTRKQLDTILGAAPQDARDAIVLMAALGLRRGECFAIRWADVDFGENLVHVRATNHRGRIADRTKTKAGTRLVPLFPSAKAMLEARRRRLPVAPHPTAFVFANAIGGAIDPGNWARREWLPALKKAGLEKRFHVHELRHFAATALDEQGMVGKLRTEIVGHANEEITNSIYTHVRRERVSAVAADFDPLREASSG